MSVNVERRRGWAARRMLPTTRMGRTACWMGLAFVAWYVANGALVGASQSVTLPRLPLILWGWAGLALGAATGVVGLVAIVRRRERGLLAYATLLPLLLVAALLVGELLVPH